MAKFEDLTGKRFNNLLVLKRIENHILPSGKPRTMWLCKCDCGNLAQVSSQALKQGTTVSCGCVGKEKRRQKALERCDDLTGQRFGKLLVLQRDNNYIVPSGQIKTKFICQCNCGNIVSVFSNSLKDGRTNSCGCERTRLSSERSLIDLTGQKFGKLTVLRRAKTKHFKGMTIVFWKCRCDCGAYTEVASQKLRSGYTKSCGCVKSQGEESVSNVLSFYGVNFKREYQFDDLRSENNYPLRFDFALFDNGKLVSLIEFQGIQHYVDIPGFGEQQRKYTDSQKKQYCKKT